MSVRKRTWETSKGEVKEAWLAVYVDGRGRRRQKVFPRKRAAEAFAAKTVVEVSDGTHVPDATSVTVAEAGKLWIDTTELAGRERTTVEQYRQHVELHIKPLIGSTKLTALSAPRVRAFEDDLTKAGRSPAMVKKVMVSLGSLLADALERGLVGRNVVREMKRRRGAADHRAEKRARGKLKVGVDIPSPDEVRLIVGALRGRSRPLLLTTIFSGLRASELRGLTWNNLDLKAGRIHVRQRADRFKAIGAPKSEAGERSVPLPAIVVNTLKEWQLASTTGETGLVFPAIRKGGPVAHRTIVDAWMAAQVRAGVSVDTGKVDDEGKPILAAKYSGLHAIRHFYASWCINARRDGGLELLPKAVQERLGHSSIKLTLDTYGHLFATSDDGAELVAAEAFFAT
jgi:integrase